MGERRACVGPRDAKTEDSGRLNRPLESPFSSLPGTIALFRRKLGRTGDMPSWLLVGERASFPHM